MSIDALRWGREITGIGCSAKFVLIALCDYGGNCGQRFLSHKQLAKDTEQSVDTVARRIADLRREGQIRFTNEYIVLHDDIAREYARELSWPGDEQMDQEQSPMSQMEALQDNGDAPTFFLPACGKPAQEVLVKTEALEKAHREARFREFLQIWPTAERDRIDQARTVFLKLNVAERIDAFAYAPKCLALWSPRGILRPRSAKVA
jgi:hypothetical protein